MGYFAKENHTCCNSCGWSDVPDVQYDKVIFYHNQDLDSLKVVTASKPYNDDWRASVHLDNIEILEAKNVPGLKDVEK